mmetsp:Transcript_7888/g.11932  ORF Transcript_7888/g.11932 Transcript_7888/m.11932 type:complete len:164 (-) Transcript_7888:54-545(-)
MRVLASPLTVLALLVAAVAAVRIESGSDETNALASHGTKRPARNSFNQLACTSKVGLVLHDSNCTSTDISLLSGICSKKNVVKYVNGKRASVGSALNDLQSALDAIQGGFSTSTLAECVATITDDPTAFLSSALSEPFIQPRSDDSTGAQTDPTASGGGTDSE